MDLGISGKTAIVTAGGSGLGEAVAWRLAQEGCRLALFSRSRDKLETVAGAIRERHGVPVAVVPGDMNQQADVDRLLATVRQELGGPDILVLNTGRPPPAMRTVLEETDDARWEAAFRTQFWGAMLVTRTVVPAIVERGWGRVIAITSATVKHPMPRHSLSTPFRSAVTGMYKHLSNEVAHAGVTVNMVCPGSIGTASLVSSYDTVARAQSLPVKRLGRPEELAAAVAFLASDLAGFITGVSLQVDGGMMSALH